MTNRIDELIKAAIENPPKYEKDLEALVKITAANPQEKEKLYKEFKESLDKRGAQIRELSIRIQLDNISDSINLSYLAKHYFKKSRQWLNQRINGNMVNGKKATFTTEQLMILNNALKDLSQKIGSINVVQTH